MPLPLKIAIFDPGAGGAPTQTNPRDLSGWAESYDDSQLTGFGHESLRISGFVQSREEAANWAARLMSSVEVYTSERTAPRFTGFLNQVKIPALESCVSLTNMANVIIARWGAPDGTQGTVTVSNAASIARYGRKERVLNESISLQADATNRATMLLTQISDPLNKAPVSAEKEDGSLFEVELTFCGWAETLKWLTTSNATETTQASTSQVSALITAYNAVNAFFDTAAAISATGHAATQYCSPDTTYFERIEKLLSFGDTAQKRIAWGFYGRAITIAVAACATPDTITYNYSKRAGKLWDVNKNFAEPWDWSPDCMTQNVDVIGPEPPSGAIASLTREYMRRATLSIGADGIPHGELEPDDVDKLADYVAFPVSKSTGISARHQYTDARIRDAMGPRTIRTDNNNLWDSSLGALRQGAGGTGVPNVGTITAPHDVDLGTGAGVGGPGSSAAIGTGTAGAVTKWATTNTLTDAISGTDYSAPHAHPYAGTSHTHPTSEVVGGLDGSGTATRLAQWTDADTLAASSLIKAGAGVLTISASTTETITIASAGGGTIDLNGAVLTLGANFTTSGGGAITLASGGTFTLTIPKTGTAVVGSGTTGNLAKWSDANTLTNAVAGTDYGTGTVAGTGTAGRLMQWASGGANAENSTLIKSGAGVLTISASTTETLTITNGGSLDLNGATLNLGANLTTAGGGAITLSSSATRTLTIPATGTAVLGDGVAGRMVRWDGTNTVSEETLIKIGAGVLTLSSASAYTAIIAGTGTVAMGGGSAGDGDIAYWSSNFALGNDPSLQWNDSTNSMAINIGTVSNARLLIKGSSSTSSNYQIYTVNSPETPIFNVRDDGAGFLFAASWTYGSDERGKENITDITRGLAHLRQIRPVRFDYIDGPQNQLGFVAQELRTVIPELVVPVDPNDPSPEPMLGVLTNNLIPIIVAAIKDIAQRIVTIENRLDAGGL